jgi:oligopeptidase B
MKNILPLLALVLIINSCEQEKMPQAPIAKQEIHRDTVNGTVLEDKYFWLRGKEKPEVIEYLEAENAYTETVMKDTEELQNTIFNEIKTRTPENDTSAPVKIDDYYYYTRTIEGKGYPLYCRKHNSLEADEEIYLDQNALAEGKKYFDLGNLGVSPDHKLLAYLTDTSGYENYTLFIKNLETGETVKQDIENASDDLVWFGDNEHLLYTTLNDVNQADKVWVHKLGTKQGEDRQIYHEKDNAYFMSVGKTRDKKHILVSLSSKDESEQWFMPADNPAGELKVIQPREKFLEYYTESRGEEFYIYTNTGGAKNFKVMKAPIASPGKENWTEVVAYNPDIKIEDIDVFENFMMIIERSGGLRKIRMHDFADASEKYLDMPDDSYSLGAGGNPNFDSEKFRFYYSSMRRPSTVFEYHTGSSELEVIKEKTVGGGYSKDDYVTERRWATAGDGTKVPVSILYKKGTELNGENPCLLYGYGSYGYPIDPAFNYSIFSLVDRGFVYAIAHIRGGGEMGREWYDGGKMLNKKNTFTDFIDVAEFLIDEKYTSSEKLAIRGGSAGGLLIGAVINMRPELFEAAMAIVPFVDVLNTMLDPTIPLTVAEYTEWGNPQEQPYFDYIRSYSPYDNIEAKEYPHLLVRAGLYDPRVHYWEPAKYVAKMREIASEDNFLLLKTNMEAGHAGASDRYKSWKENAFDYAFALKALGIE